MNSRNDIRIELEQLSSSLPLDAKTPVFDLPEGYFENFAARVLAIVKGEQAENAADELATLSPLLAGLPRKNPFTLPENYFEENTTLLPVAAADDDDALPAWMQQSRTLPFAVPQGYFESLAPAVLQQVQPAAKPQAKVVSMTPRKWMQYAAAAVVAGALVLGGLFYNDGSKPNPVRQPQAWVENKLHNVSSEELEEFIEAVDFSSAGTETAQQKSTPRTDVRRMLQDVPVSELDAFLEQMPTGAENLN